MDGTTWQTYPILRDLTLINVHRMNGNERDICIYHYTIYQEHNLNVLCHYRYTIYCPLNLNLRGLL